MKKERKTAVLLLLCSALLVVFAAYKLETKRNRRDIEEPSASFSIPEERLRRMTTGALIETVLTNQRIGGIWLDNTLQEGFEMAYQQYDIFPELFSRDAAPGVLMQYYMDCGIITDPEGYRFALPDALLEILLTQEPIRNRLSDSERGELDARIHQNYCTRLQYPAIFGGKDVSPAYHCQRVLLEELFRSGKDTQAVLHPYSFVLENAALDFGAHYRAYPAMPPQG